jgi:magnesium-transporting ATPase (P-type)
LNTRLTNNQYMWDDMGIVLPLAIAMLYTRARPTLSHQRPPNTLFSLPIVASLLGQIILYAAFFGTVFVLLNRQPWFCSRADGMTTVSKYMNPVGGANLTSLDPEPQQFCAFYTSFANQVGTTVDDIAQSYEDTEIWLCGHLSYFTVAIAFNLPDRFRRSCITNVYFMGLLLGLLSVTVWMVFDTSSTIDDTFQTVPLPGSFRWLIFGAWNIHFVAAQIWELFATWVLPWWRERWMRGSSSMVMDHGILI